MQNSNKPPRQRELWAQKPLTHSRQRLNQAIVSIPFNVSHLENKNLIPWTGCPMMCQCEIVGTKYTYIHTFFVFKCKRIRYDRLVVRYKCHCRKLYVHVTFVLFLTLFYKGGWQQFVVAKVVCLNIAKLYCIHFFVFIFVFFPQYYYYRIRQVFMLKIA